MPAPLLSLTSNERGDATIPHQNLDVRRAGQVGLDNDFSIVTESIEIICPKNLGMANTGTEVRAVGKVDLELSTLPSVFINTERKDRFPNYFRAFNIINCHSTSLQVGLSCRLCALVHTLKDAFV
jgi:hypothetical protein